MKKIMILMCVICLVSAVIGDDIRPPSWRGLGGTTVQEWEFFADLGPEYGPPEEGCLYNNPYGESVAYDDPGGNSAKWLENYMGRAGVLEFIGPYALVFDIPNNPNPNEEKWIQIQTTFYSAQSWPLLHGPAGTHIMWEGGLYSSDDTVTPQSWIDVGQGWYVHIFEIVLPENPDFERIEVFWNSGGLEPYYVDQVVIDTYCVPEPATLAIFGLGCLGLLKRRK